MTVINFNVGTYYGCALSRIGSFYYAHLGRKLVYEAYTLQEVKDYIDKL